MSGASGTEAPLSTARWRTMRRNGAPATRLNTAKRHRAQFSPRLSGIQARAAMASPNASAKAPAPR